MRIGTLSLHLPGAHKQILTKMIQQRSGENRIFSPGERAGRPFPRDPQTFHHSCRQRRGSVQAAKSCGVLEITRTHAREARARAREHMLLNHETGSNKLFLVYKGATPTLLARRAGVTLRRARFGLLCAPLLFAHGLTRAESVQAAAWVYPLAAGSGVGVSSCMRLRYTNFFSCSAVLRAGQEKRTNRKRNTK